MKNVLIEKDIDRDGQFKLYIQIYGVIRRMIEEGDWQPNTMIPSEDELCRIFAVSKTTVRLALSALVREGYLRRQQGKGTFVKSPVPNSGFMMITRISESPVRDGIFDQRESLESEIVDPDDEVRKQLDYNGSVFFAQCRNSGENEPVCIEELYVPLVFFPGIEAENMCVISFLSLIKKRSIRKLSRIVQTIEIVPVKESMSWLLKINEGDPVLLMHRVFIDSEDRTIALMRLYGICGKYQIRLEFESLR